ncbi:MAG: family 43 glycosylhydrolase [Gloeobacteraceae cyanobacterium ES-bin-144]|nr:family 43 glycosylhydrolase [Verrucomicrobiales bacterium]
MKPLLALFCLCFCPLSAESFKPGQVWMDTDGKPINAHAGGILLEKDRYYWFGQPMSDLPAGKKFPPSAGNLTEVGVTCYSSDDLYGWRDEGVVLSVSQDPKDDLYKGLRIERPKVVRSTATGKYVMWFHYVRSGMTHAESYEAAVCVADKITGPFQLVKIFRPNGGQIVRDCTLFQDDDGSTYFYHASEENKTMHVIKLTPDCLDASSEWRRIFIDQSREAPAVFKHHGRYYMITSGCTGWLPNPSLYHQANHPLGPWKTLGNPFVNDTKVTSFDSQSTFVLPVQGQPGSFIYMGDRWNTQSMGDSRYIWLPIRFNYPDQIEIHWMDEWNLSTFSK